MVHAWMLKHALVTIATLPPFPLLLERLIGRRPTIFTLHRFEDRDLGVEGHSEANLRANLSLVRRLGYQVLPVHEFIAATVSRTLPVHCLSFTVDDGYQDFITRGAPVFRDFDCPVTMFATTGFVDGRLWFWWDQLEYAFSSSRLTSLTLDIGGRRQAFAWRSPAERQTAAVDLVVLLKRHTLEVQRQAVSDALVALQVEVPASPPRRYGPMSWSECNALAAHGVTVGPHSVSHPNLARCTDEESRHEIHASWVRVQQAAVAPIPIFCFPFGDSTAFGAREQRLVREEGLLGALGFPERPPRTLRDATPTTCRDCGTPTISNSLRSNSSGSTD